MDIYTENKNLLFKISYVKNEKMVAISQEGALFSLIINEAEWRFKSRIKEKLGVNCEFVFSLIN